MAGRSRRGTLSAVTAPREQLSVPELSPLMFLFSRWESKGSKLPLGSVLTVVPSEWEEAERAYVIHQTVNSGKAKPASSAPLSFIL